MRLLAVLAVVLAMGMIVPAHATVATITPSSADTILSGRYQSYIAGTCGSVQVQSGSAVPPTRSLVKFDLSSMPSGSTICTAFLQLYYYSYTTLEGYVDPVGRIYTANQVTTDWVEGTCCGCYPPDGSGATWNKPNSPTSGDWGTLGGDFTATGAASQTVPATFGFVTWDVTTIVKAWIETGQPNYGFLMKDLSEGTGATSAANFYSREYGSNMPILRVNLSPSGGCPAVGGVVLPVNTVGLVAPWIAVIGCIGTLVVVAKKHRS